MPQALRSEARGSSLSELLVLVLDVPFLCSLSVIRITADQSRRRVASSTSCESSSWTVGTVTAAQTDHRVLSFSHLHPSISASHTGRTQKRPATHAAPLAPCLRPEPAPFRPRQARLPRAPCPGDAAAAIAGRRTHGAMRRANSFASSTAALARAIADRLQGKAAPSPAATMRRPAAGAAPPSSSAEKRVGTAAAGTHEARGNGEEGEPGAITDKAAAAARRAKPPSKPAADAVNTDMADKQLQPSAQRPDPEQAQKRRRVDQSEQPRAPRRCRAGEQAPTGQRQATGKGAGPDKRQRTASRRRCEPPSANPRHLDAICQLMCPKHMTPASRSKP